MGNVNATEKIVIEAFVDEVNPTLVNVDKRPLKGGFILENFTATDNIGVSGYDIIINGTDFDISIEELATTTWTGPITSGGIDLYLYSGKVIVALPATYEGVNVTVTAKDFGGLESDPEIFIESVEEGMWIKIDLYEGWNLISLPLIPQSTAREDILSLVLKQGPSGVVVVYGYDQYNDAWITNPAEMTDGWGYWLYIQEDDVLIVQGRETPEPPALPPTYEFTEGWVLGGFKSTTNMDLDTGDGYLGSLESGSYFPYVYVWDAENQRWVMRDVSADSLDPGEGFWIWMYEDQYLIPPIPE